MADFLFITIPLTLIICIIMFVIKDNKKRNLKENEQNSIIVNEDKKPLCYWCKQKINSGAKICPYCKKVPTKTGNDNRQVEIFIGIILFVISFFLLFSRCAIKISLV